MMLRSRKGMSMVEVVIAMAIIAIISASALSMIMMSVNVEADTEISVEVAESVDNAVACFRFAQTKEDFLQALQKTAPYEENPENPGEFLLQARGFTVTILVSQDEFAYTAVDSDSEIIYSFTYAKGSAAAAPTLPQEGGAE